MTSSSEKEFQKWLDLEEYKRRKSLQATETKEEREARRLKEFLEERKEREYQRSIEMKEALKDVDVILAANISDIDYLLVRGRLLHELNRNDAAFTTYNYILRLDPNKTKALIGRSLTRGNYESALSDLNQALIISSDNKDNTSINDIVDVLIWRGKMKENYKKYEEALNDYNEALLLNPRSVQALIDRSELFNLLGRYEDEMRDSMLMMVLNPAEVRANFIDRIDRLRKSGKSEQASKQIDRMLALFPEEDRNSILL